MICMHHRYLMALKSNFAVGLSRSALDRCNSARKVLNPLFGVVILCYCNAKQLGKIVKVLLGGMGAYVLKR